MNIQDMWLQAQLQKQGGIPSNQINPALQAAAQRQAMPQLDGNPLNEGAVSAMHATREALSHRPKQHGMVGNLLDSAGKTLQNFAIARLRGSSRAPTAHFGHMMRTPDELEQENMASNMNVLKFLSAKAQAEQENAHRNAVLAEQRRYHDVMSSQRAQALAARNQAMANKESMVNDETLARHPLIKTSKERNMYATRLKEATEARGLILKSLENLNELEKLNEGNPIDPTGSLLPGANQLSNVMTRYSKKGRKQFGIRNRLNSDFSKLEILLERTLKGGVPDAQTIKRLHEEKVYPGMGQPIELNRQKLEEVLKEVDGKISDANFSLVTGRHRLEEEPVVEKEVSHQPSLSNISTEDLMAELQKLKSGE